MEKIKRLLDPCQVNLVLYHGYCTDGFGAAWVAHTMLGASAQYIGVNYGRTNYLQQFDPRGKNIVLIDFSFDLETCNIVKNLANSFVILDHHKTAEETLSKLDYAYFDMNKSGITLAWEYFREGPIPEFVRCIETHDLWKFEERRETCPHAKAFTSYWYNEVGQNVDVDFKKYYQLYQNPDLFNVYIEYGKVLLGYIDNLVKKKGSDAVDMLWQSPDKTMYRVKV
ncbi:MAG: hypothetical protein ABI340_05475, partial [Nitrososphaera sp.]